MAANKPLHNHVFYDNVTDMTETDTCIMSVVSDMSTMSLEFICDGTFTAKLYGAIIDKNNFKAYPCLKMPQFDLMVDAITDDAYLYQVDVTSIDYLKVKLTALEGNIMVRAKVVG